MIYQPPSYFERLRLEEMFPRAQPLEVELGAGDGSFIVHYASAHPERNFLAVERLMGRLRKVDRKSRRAGLANLRAMRVEAAYLVEYLLPPASVLALHVYFPDPWPKRRHKTRRLINSHFTEVAAQALRPGGRIYLRTDDADYFSQMQAVFQENPSFTALSMPPEPAGFLTDFEEEFQAKGIATLSAAFQRQARA